MIKTVFGRNVTVVKKNHLRTEYGEIINASEIPNGKDEIDDVWNESGNEEVPDKNAVNITKVCLLVMIEVLVSQGIFIVI